jgi:molybdate transport system substrate-binding protein
MRLHSLPWLRGCLLAAAMLVGHADAGTDAATAGHSLVVFGAASLTDALQELGADFTKSTGTAVKFSFAASSTLARQVQSGAPADVIVFADTEWMDDLESRKLIQSQSRHDLLSNRLVLVAPAESTLELKIEPNFELAAALGKGRLATGDPDSVPAGRYARAALTTLGVWTTVENRIVRADNVRAALAYVDRGEVPLGIVYKTDALIDSKVRIVDVFPLNSHPPITYPIAVAIGAKPGASEFADYLRKPTADAVFAKYGFIPLH